MKRLAAIILIALTTTLHGQALVDLTLGGYESGHFPMVFWKLFGREMHFFDEAAQGWFDTPEGKRYFNNWVSLYGDLDGGRFFFTNLFVLWNPRRAQVWWNFVNAPRGYKPVLIHVWGRKNNGVAWEHLYYVRDWLAGEASVTLDGTTGINSIAFYGYEQ